MIYYIYRLSQFSVPKHYINVIRLIIFTYGCKTTAVRLSVRLSLVLISQWLLRRNSSNLKYSTQLKRRKHIRPVTMEWSIQTVCLQPVNISLQWPPVLWGVNRSTTGVHYSLPTSDGGTHKCIALRLFDL